MQIRSRIERRFWTNALLPDVFIGILVASITSSGLLGVFGTVIGLQILYLVLWIKSAVWTWVTFWIGGRKSLVGSYTII